MKKCLILFCCLWVAIIGGCGVNAPPIPPDAILPKGVTNLQATVVAEGVALKWQIPTENVDGSRPAAVARFLVLRRVEDKEGCLQCPGEYTVIKEINLATREGYQIDKGVIVWVNRDITPKKVYLYKVVGVNRWGYQGPPSNEVMVNGAEGTLWPSPTPEQNTSP